ncbi:hypothetical protein LTR95_012147 [Oleoguttula sp. CCFEE 5521]
MPPKRARNAPPSASQPLPQRATRKRRASDASTASERPASSQGLSVPGLSAPAKRRKTKKTRTASDEPEVILEEEEQIEVASDLPQMDGTVETVARGVEAELIEANEAELPQSRSRHVHFGSDEVDVDGSTAQHKTPYAAKTQTTKMSVKRRMTASPSLGGSKRYKTSTQRTSLPAHLSLNEATETRTVQEHHFASLREVLDERIRHLLSQHGEQKKLGKLDQHTRATLKELDELRIETQEKEKRIKELIVELETDEDDEVDLDRHQAVEAEIARLRHDVLANRARGHIDSLPDNDMMVIDSQQEVSYPQIAGAGLEPVTPTAVSKRTSIHHSQDIVVANGRRTSGQGLTDAERRTFEDTIVVLAQEANDAKTQLRLETIGLQALGFSAGDVQPSIIIQAIRESFESIREKMYARFPDSLPEDATNADLLEILFANSTEFADRLVDQDRDFQRQIAHSTDLQVQVDKLIDHLAAAEIRIDTLQAQWKQLDELSDTKERDIEELEEQLAVAEEQRDDLVAKLKEKHDQLTILEADNISLQQSLDKLNVSLQGYRDEETRLQILITKMETEHNVTITKMNQSREVDIEDLESRLDAEIILRNEAEKQGAERQVLITELEAHIEEIAVGRNALREQLEQVKADLMAEQSVREQAETSALDKDAEVADLETRVEKLETELEVLTTELADLRNLNDAERRQREAAETDLDDRNAEIEELNQKLHQQGVEANSLRQKMFEVQQQNTIRVQELELLASERDAQFQVDIADEIDRREAAEGVTRLREVTIVELQKDLTAIQLSMADTLAERDERIAELENEVADRNAEILRLQNDLRATENLLTAEVAQSDQRREQNDAAIILLQTNITTLEASIITLQRDHAQVLALHDSETEDRNAAIATLNHTIAVHLTEISDLQKQKSGLEHRVNEEAEQFLLLQADTGAEIDSLKDTIRDKQAKILIVEEKAIEADARWQEVLDARDEEIGNLRAEAETTTTTVEEITAQSTSLKQRFQAYIYRTDDVVKNLHAELARAKAAVDAEGGALKQEGDDILEQLEGMDTVSEMRVSKKVTTTQTQSSAGASSSQQSATGKKGAGGRKVKKRVYDSGFGVASDEVEGESLAAL